MQTKLPLLGLSLPELKQSLSELELPNYRIEQIWHWVYVAGVRSFEMMTNLPLKIRVKLDELYTLKRAEVSKELISFDESRKWLLKFTDNNEVETVYIPDKIRGTLCISSQVGCTLTCKFCHTGTQKLVRNLTSSEIIAQFMLAKDSFEDWPSNKEQRKLTNIVMMGMGEPLYNYDNVSRALKIVMNPLGIKLSKRNITLSTSGVVPQIDKCADDLGVNLTISLHAVNDELRNYLVPINKKYPLTELLNACRNYAGKVRGRITFEYVMLRGINDSKTDAKHLVKLIRGIPAKINLIPFNSWPDAEFECSSEQIIRSFASILENAGYMAPIRTPRGQDILAACGQLKTESQRISKSTMNTQ